MSALLVVHSGRYVDRRCLMVRSLPIRVPPHPGEGLDSYLEAVAARHHGAWGDVLDAVGLDTPTSGGRAVYSWLTVLPADRARDLQTGCGVDGAAVQSMTLAGLIGSAGESHCTAAPVVPMCLSPPRSRFCPACLAETGGRWQLWWRLRWAFACPTHQCLLADTCPCCDRWQRTGAHPHGLVPTPGRCSRTADDAYGRDLRRCGADLSAAPAPRYLRDSAVLDGAVDHPGRLPRRACRLRHLRARPGVGYAIHRRPVGPGRPDTALRPHRGSRRPASPPTSSTAIGSAWRTVRRTHPARPPPAQEPPRRPSPPSSRCAY